MPPQGMPRPDAATLGAFVASLEGTLDRQASAAVTPGHKPPHRLNRTEYGNAIRDLLDLNVDASNLLPADDESFGFDNIAGVLRISPSLLEQYLGAARKVSGLAVGTDKDVIRLGFRVPPDDSQEDQVDSLPLGTRGGLSFTHTFPQDAEYEFSVFLLRNIVGYMIGLEFAHQLEISIDGERVFTAQVGGEQDNLASDKNMSETANVIDQRLKARVKVKAGPRTVAVTFIKRNHAESDEPLQPHERNHDLQDMNGLPQVDHVNLTGPFNPTGPGDTPSRRRIFACRPAQAAEEAACARKVLSTLARRAYRRPVTADDMAPVMEQYRGGPEGRLVRHRRRARAEAHPRQPQVPLPRRAGAVEAGAGHRPRAGVTVVVLPLELDSRRRAHRRRGERPPVHSRRHRTSGGAHARRPQGARTHRQLRQPVAAAAQPARARADARRLPELRQRAPPGVPAGNRALLPEHRQGEPQRSRPDQRRLHVRERAAGAALRHAERLRQQLPPRRR